MAEELQRELSWTGYELRIAILQVLFGIFIKSPSYPSVTSTSVKDLSNILYPSTEMLDTALRWLLDQKSIEMSGERYDITDKGVDFLKDELDRSRVALSIRMFSCFIVHSLDGVIN
jgi:CTP-dependent riboflavin kinase